MKTKRKAYAKVAFTLSLCVLILWSVLGMGTSIAWFADTSPVVKNTFDIANLKLSVYHKLDDGSYEEIDRQTSVFDDEALYEPGYVQVVYLKVKNNGDVPFDYKIAVDLNSVTIGKNEAGKDIYLPDYLNYGVVFGESEAELNRELAKLMSSKKFPDRMDTYPLNTYSEKDSVTVDVQGERYIAVIVRMPEGIGNVANYRGDVVPTVELGINISASQVGTL